MELLAKAQVLPATLPARFRKRVKLDPESDCWLWTGAGQGTGYGVYKATSGEPWSMAHRVAYEILVGPIPKGLYLDHRCRVRNCVNPAHLEPVTTRTNTLRGNSPPAVNARKVFCIRGHPLFGANLHRKIRNGWPIRECRACKRFLGRRWLPLE